MNSTEMLLEQSSERHDLLLEEAFLQATDSVIVVPNTLQRALFPRLSTQDTGLLVRTGPGAGRLEAVFVPLMCGTSRDNPPHRLYIIAPDSGVLDDYLYRLLPYVRSLSAVRRVPITVFVDLPEPFCRRYLSDGTFEDGFCNHPLDAEVDLVVAHFSSFLSLFFGAGGVHALPGELERNDDFDHDLLAHRRDLFYFDEAQSYDRDRLTRFVSLVEFLYAEDLDVIVGSTTLPESCREELSFLEDLSVPGALYEPPRSLSIVPAEKSEELSVVLDLIKQRYFESSRAGVVLEKPEEVEECFELLSSLYPQLVFCYHSEQPRAERAKTYALLRELEKEGEGYLLVCDGKVLESGDIDVNLLITSVCAPESLILRAGRCNRRGDLAMGDIVVIGKTYTGRVMPQVQREDYLSTLNSFSVRGQFLPDQWKTFIV